MRLQLYNLLQRSIELNSSNLFMHILKNGPFLDGYFKLRNKILTVASEKGAVTKVKITTIGDGLFLNFIQEYSAPDSALSNYSSLFLSMHSLNSTPFELLLEGEKNKNAEVAGTFMREFFNNSRWHFLEEKRWNEKIFDESRPLFSPIEMVDIFLYNWKDTNKRLVVDENFYSFLDTMALGLIGQETIDHLKMNKRMVELLKIYLEIYPEKSNVIIKSDFDFMTKTSKLIKFLEGSRVL